MGDKFEAVIPTADNIKTLLDAGKALGTVVDGSGCKPFVIVPEKYKVQTLDLPPGRVQNDRTFEDSDSFALYVNRFKTKGTLLFAKVDDHGCSVSAAIDYHDMPYLPGAPAEATWCSHFARLRGVVTKEWATWMQSNAEKMDQVKFALFLEDNQRLFRSPTGSDLLELVSTLEGKSNVRFNSAFRLQNGKTRLDYEEDVELRGVANAVNGAVEVPTQLICAIAPFEGQQPYEVVSRLRYRIEGRKLSFWYETVTPHLIIRDAARSILAEVREKIDAPLLRVA